MAFLSSIYRELTQPTITENDFGVPNERIQEIFKFRHFSSSNCKQLRKDIALISDEELQVLLIEFFDSLSQDIETEDPFEIIEELAELIPLEKLQDAIRKKYPLHIDALTTAKESLQRAQFYLKNTQGPASPSIGARLSSILDILIIVLESFLSALGVAEVFQPTENDLHASIKAQKIMMIISIFTLLTATLLPMLGVTTGGSIVGGCLLFIAVLSVIYPHIRAVPTVFPGEHKIWTKQIRNGELRVISGRKEINDEIDRILTEHKLPLLVGPTGIGKTQAVQAFVHAVEQGKYPQHRGKVFVYYNTETLVNDTEMFQGGNKILKKIIDAMAGHKNEIVLILDEAHLVFSKKESADFADKLKTVLGGDIPYVIGITTDEEYKKHFLENPSAFTRRFEKIAVGNPTEKKTLKMLRKFLLIEGRDVICDEEALQHLLDNTRGRPQPLTAMSILKTCIERTGITQKPPKEVQSKTNERKGGMRSKGVTGQGSDLLPYSDEVIEKLEESVDSLKVELNPANTRRNLFKAKALMVDVKKAMFQSVVKVSHLRATRLTSENKKDLNTYLLLSHFLSPSLDQAIRKQAGQLKLNVVITTELIDEVLLEEAENARKMQEMLEGGKEPKEKEKEGS